jgi:hypothetical protein
MSWLAELHAELGRAGIRGRTRRRIELEFADHVACEPGCEGRLGAPREVAQRFASELRIVRTRRATWVGFLALAVAACGLAATTRAYSAAGGWPDVPGWRGLTVALTGIVILFASQVAFVAGMLGVARSYAVRGRRDVPAGELALVQRRLVVGLAAGVATIAGMTVHVVLLWGVMPLSWDIVALTSVAVPAAALAGAVGLLVMAREVTPAGAGPAAGLAADVPDRLKPLTARPGLLLLLVGLPVSLIVLAGTAHAEQSLLEGLERGVAEGLAIVGGFALLGRRLGIR